MFCRLCHACRLQKTGHISRLLFLTLLGLAGEEAATDDQIATLFRCVVGRVESQTSCGLLSTGYGVLELPSSGACVSSKSPACASRYRGKAASTPLRFLRLYGLSFGGTVNYLEFISRSLQGLHFIVFHLLPSTQSPVKVHSYALWLSAACGVIG